MDLFFRVKVVRALFIMDDCHLFPLCICWPAIFLRGDLTGIVTRAYCGYRLGTPLCSVVVIALSRMGFVLMLLE